MSTAVRSVPRSATAAGGTPPRPLGGLEATRQRLYRPFLLPALALYTALFVLPSLAGVVISLGRWGGLGTDFSFVGLDNYRRLVQDPAFREAFGNTLLLLVMGGLGVFALTFLAMTVLREMKGRAFLRSVVFIPFIISPIAIGVALGFLLNPDGAVNTLLHRLGADGLRQAWLAPDMIFKVIVVGLVWSTGGFYVTLLMSGVDAIPSSLYEDARLAGASRLAQFWYITLPLTWELFSIAAVFWVINAMKVFEIVIAFTGTAGTPAVEARTAAVQQYLAVTGGRDGVPELGYSSAIGLVIFALTAVLVVLVRRLTRRDPVEL